MWGRAASALLLMVATAGAVSEKTMPNFRYVFPEGIVDGGGQVTNIAAFDALPDDTTDDAAAIAKAVSRACATTKHLLIPSGTFIVRASGGEGVELTCDDLMVSGDGVLYWDTEDTSVTGILWANGKSGIKIDGITLRQDNTTATFNASFQQNAGILLENTDDSIITRVTCEDIYGNGCVKLTPGATATNGSDRNVVAFSVFKRCSVYGAVVTSGKDNKFVHNTVEDCRLGSETDNTSNAVPGTTVEDNDIYAVLKTGDAAERVGITLGGRDADDTAQKALFNRLYANAHIFVSGAPNAILTGNDVSGQTSTIADRSPIHITSSNGAKVSGGTIDGSTFAAALTAGRGLISIVTTNDVTVENVTVKNSLNGHGIGLREAMKTMIRDNKITGNTGTGIHVYLDSDNTTVDGNDVIDNNPSNNSNQFGIYVDGDSNNTLSGIVVQNNTIISPASDKQGIPIRFADGTDYVFTNNIVSPRQAGAAVSITGTVTFATPSELGPAPAAQTIGAGGTVAADACTGVKRITAAGVVTTSTTNTFTAPAATSTGCAMDVCNVGVNAITLDANVLFLTAGGTDVALGTGDCVRVAGDGTMWRQIAAAVDLPTTTTVTTTSTTTTT